MLMSNIDGNEGGESTGVQPFRGLVTTNIPFHTEKKKYQETTLCLLYYAPNTFLNYYSEVTPYH